MFRHIVGECERQVSQFACMHCIQLKTMKLLNRIMERTEAITIFENDRCRKIYAMQHRPQIFFQKDNVCAGKINLENIKIVSMNLVSGNVMVLNRFTYITENQRSPINLCR